MPKAPVKRFARHLQDIETARGRMELLFKQGHLLQRDLDTTYEALYLRAVAHFEAYLELLFLSILQAEAKYPAARGVRRLIRIGPTSRVRDLVMQGNAFASWLPIENAQKRAKVYLKEGRPFSEISEPDRKMLATISTIRNAIAHKSEYARRKFEKDVVGTLSLITRERTPAGFLRLTVGTSTKFEAYIGELARIASELS